ncbi:MAG: flagellar basal body protein FliL [Robiginitomaculum sp.]|nr:MAG: flagellar basal body protein FliL [Robiginitomaculum sp.]
MAKDDEEPDDDISEDGEEEGDGKKAGLKKKLLFIGLPVVLVLLLGTVAALMFLGGDKKNVAEHDGTETAQNNEGHGEAKESEHTADPVFYELPAIYANIVDDDGENSVLKLIVLLEVDDEETIKKIEPLLPRIVDRYQGFLRELRMEDVKGSAGYYRLKLELLRRVNQAVAPVQVNDLTIDTLLVN